MKIFSYIFLVALLFLLPAGAAITKESQQALMEAKNTLKQFLQKAVDTGVAEKLPDCVTVGHLVDFYDIKNKSGEIWKLRPLDVALEFDNQHLLKLLIEKNVDRASCLSKTVLLFSAIERKKNNCVQWLIEFGGVNINGADPYGRTPLMFAAYKNYEIAKFLLEKGAEQDLKDKFGKTARDYAFDSKNDQMKELFVIQGKNQADANKVCYLRKGTERVALANSLQN